jgi:hypothetical protein
MHDIDSHAGPASYALGGMGAQAVKKACLESTRRGGFGSTAVRIQPMTKKTEVELPGPAHYQVKEKPEPRYHQMSSNFASMSTRLHTAPNIVKVLFHCISQWTAPSIKF